MKYINNKDYDTSIKINKTEYKAFSKKYYKKYLKDKVKVTGSLFLDKKKYLIKDEYFYLNDKRYRLYQFENKHFLNKRIRAYLESDDGLVAIYRNNYLFVLLLIVLLVTDLLLLNHYFGIKHTITANNKLTNNISGVVTNSDGDTRLSLVNDDKTLETTPDEENKYLFTDVENGSVYYLIAEDSNHRYIETINYKDQSETRDVSLSDIDTYIYINNETDKKIYLENVGSLISYEGEIDSIILNISIKEYEGNEDEYLSDYIYSGFEVEATLQKYKEGSLISEEYLDTYDTDIGVYIDEYDYVDNEVMVKDIAEDKYLESNSIYNRYLYFNIGHSGEYLISYEDKEIRITGTSSFEYSDEVYLNTNTNELTYTLLQDDISTNRVMVEIYVKDDLNDLVLLSRSETREIGKEEDTLVSDVDLTIGIYSGVMKLIYLDEDNEKICDVDIDVYIIANS